MEKKRTLDFATIRAHFPNDGGEGGDDDDAGKKVEEGPPPGPNLDNAHEQKGPGPAGVHKRKRQEPS